MSTGYHGTIGAAFPWDNTSTIYYEKGLYFKLKWKQNQIMEANIAASRGVYKAI